jgi:hypothetical protein
MKFKAKTGIKIDIPHGYAGARRQYMWFNSRKKTTGGTYWYEYEMITVWKDKERKYIDGNMVTTKVLNQLVGNKHNTSSVINIDEWLAQKALIMILEGLK